MIEHLNFSLTGRGTGCKTFFVKKVLHSKKLQKGNRNCRGEHCSSATSLKNKTLPTEGRVSGADKLGYLLSLSPRAHEPKQYWCFVGDDALHRPAYLHENETIFTANRCVCNGSMWASTPTDIKFRLTTKPEFTSKKSCQKDSSFNYSSTFSFIRSLKGNFFPS